MKKDNQHLFWEQAGQDGYGGTMFSNSSVEEHIRLTIWDAAVKTARVLGLSYGSRILELGCGDGIFAGTVLAKNFHEIDGYDYSTSAIKRANSLYGTELIHFFISNISELVYSPGQHWDGAFLMGFIHHVKESARIIVNRLSKVAPNVVVVDPNGNNLIRKALECLPSYRRAGENSFRLNQLKGIFNSAGYELVSQNIVSFVPPFTPSYLLWLMIALEKIVDASSLLKRVNSTYVLGFKRVEL